MNVFIELVLASVYLDGYVEATLDRFSIPDWYTWLEKWSLSVAIEADASSAVGG